MHKYPFKTGKELKREVAGFQEMSVRRIQEVLRSRLALPSRAAAAKPLLTEKMARARLRFARKNRHVTPEEWEKTMFSDESDQPQGAEGEEEQADEPLPQQVHGEDRQTPAQCYGVGLFFGGGGQGLHLLLAGGLHHEQREVRHCPEGEALPLDEDARLQQVPAGWRPLPQEQGLHGPA